MKIYTLGQIPPITFHFTFFEIMLSYEFKTQRKYVFTISLVKSNTFGNLFQEIFCLNVQLIVRVPPWLGATFFFTEAPPTGMLV